MKLYTETQVEEMLMKARFHNSDDTEMYSNEYLISQYKAIELQSNEQIEEKYYKELEERREVAKNFKGQVAGRHPDMFGHSEIHHMVRGYLEAIQSLRDKIQGGNNDQQ